MKQRTKKRPEDYPSFAFRITKADKIEITTALKSLKKRTNHRKSKEHFTTKQNEILVSAIKIGLQALKKRYQ